MSFLAGVLRCNHASLGSKRRRVVVSEAILWNSKKAWLTGLLIEYIHDAEVNMIDTTTL